MKKLFTLLLFSLIVRTVLGQTTPDLIRTPVTPSTGSNKNNRTTVDANLYAAQNLRIPRASSFTLNNAKDSIGYIMFNTTTSRFGVYRGSGIWDTYIAVADTANLFTGLVHTTGINALYGSYALNNPASPFDFINESGTSYTSDNALSHKWFINYSTADSGLLFSKSGQPSFTMKDGGVILRSSDNANVLWSADAGNFIQNNQTSTPQNARISLTDSIKTTSVLLATQGIKIGNTLTSKGGNLISSLFNNTYADPTVGETILQSVLTVSAVTTPLSTTFAQRAFHAYLNVAGNNAYSWAGGGDAILAEVHLTPSSSANTIPYLAALEFSITNNANAPTITNMYGLYGSGLGFSGSETNAAAIASVTPTGATNTTNLLLGTIAIPTGNHNIYTISNWDSYLGTGVTTVGGLTALGGHIAYNAGKASYNALDVMPKQRTDSLYASSGSGVTSFNTRTGVISLTSSDVTTALGYTPISSIVGVSGRTTTSGPPSNTVIDISSSYAGQTSITVLGTIATGTWQGTVIAPAYLNATNTNTSSTIVARDASGNFLANSIALGTASISSNSILSGAQTFNSPSANVIGISGILSVNAISGTNSKSNTGILGRVIFDVSNTQNWTNTGGSAGLSGSLITNAGGIGIVSNAGSLKLTYSNSAGVTITNGYYSNFTAPDVANTTNFTYLIAGGTQSTGNWFIDGSNVTYPSKLGGNITAPAFITLGGTTSEFVDGTGALQNISGISSPKAAVTVYSSSLANYLTSSGSVVAGTFTNTTSTVNTYQISLYTNCTAWTTNSALSCIVQFSDELNEARSGYLNTTNLTSVGFFPSACYVIRSYPGTGVTIYMNAATGGDTLNCYTTIQQIPDF